MSTLVFGAEGEEIATKYLIKHGYAILVKNFRSKLGEIDIIAYKNNAIIFIEVKSRKSLLFGAPSESIRNKKLRSIIKTAEYYLLLNPKLPYIMRFDAIEIVKSDDARYSINHIKNITM